MRVGISNNDIVEGLKLTEDLWEFDPDTGNKVERYAMNDIDRATYDAVCGALERLTPKKVDGSEIDLVDLGNGAWRSVGGYKCPNCQRKIATGVSFCTNCGQALDWRKE